jgi:hypothetical protein
MPFGHCAAGARARLATLTVAIAVCWTTQIAAQVYYNGYDIGPDYGAMLREQEKRGQQLDREIQARTADVVQRTMQNPDCYAKYQQHLAQGGTLSYPQFAYQYAATGGFTPEGIQRYRTSEQQNQQREYEAWQELQRAQRERQRAQQQHADRYSRNQNQAGDVLQGRSWWIDPTTGQRQALPYIGPNQGYVDPRTGNRYWRDESGRYAVQTPSGQWAWMVPTQ